MYARVLGAALQGEDTKNSDTDLLVATTPQTTLSRCGHYPGLNRPALPLVNDRQGKSPDQRMGEPASLRHKCHSGQLVSFWNVFLQNAHQRIRFGLGHGRKRRVVGGFVTPGVRLDDECHLARRHF